MGNDDRLRRWWAIPVVLSLGVFTGMNALWNYTVIRDKIPYYIGVVLLVGGSGLALGILWLATGAGWISRREIGLDLSGWTAPRRLLGLAVILLMGYGGFSLLRNAPDTPGQGSAGISAPTPAPSSGEGRASTGPGNSPGPTWGDYCFWFVMMLPPSMAEVLVFIGVAFCLTRRGLQEGRAGPVLATGLPLLGVSVAFGLFHYSYPPQFRAIVFLTMGSMFLDLLVFLATRNLYLTLGVHNAFVAVGFTKSQNAAGGFDPSVFLETPALIQTFLAFGVPFLVLHWLEWKGIPGSAARTAERPVA